MVNSELAEGIVAKGVFNPGATSISIDEVIPGNIMLQRPSEPHDDVEGFWRAHEKHGFEGAARYVGAYGFVKTVKTLVKRLMGRG